MVQGSTLTVYDTEATPPSLSAEQNESPTPSSMTIGVDVIPRGTMIDDRYSLNNHLITQVKVENDKYVLVSYQVDEYGIGNSVEEARKDLLESLVDYLVSLERREPRLANRELTNLQLLRNMLARR